MRVAVVGAGWAGLAAALEATRQGHRVTVFEASRHLGGRARALATTLPDGSATVLDNGQHILIGAYHQTLGLMRSVGVNPEAAMLRVPLRLQWPDGTGLALPHWSGPVRGLDSMVGVWRAQGWRWQDKVALLRTMLRWRVTGFRCAATLSVRQLCQDLPPLILQTLIEPLCVSALNTPSQHASGQVFLRVLQDSLLSGPGGSNLLLPRTDLSRLFPLAAAQWLHNAGADIRTAQRVTHLAGTPAAVSTASTASTPSALTWQVNHEDFDHVIWATCASQAAQAMQQAAASASAPIAQALLTWAHSAQALAFEAIATVYAYAAGVRLPHPMLALPSTAAQPAQFVFDRGQLDGPQGLLALVVSASPLERANLQTQVLAQAQQQLATYLKGQPLQALQTVVEKRATFACTPALVRPPQAIAPGLQACGDYVDGPYPATLEGAVRSGIAAARLLHS